MFTLMENFVENIVYGHRDSDTGKEFIYSQGIIPIMFILCESDGKFNDRRCLYSAKYCHTKNFQFFWEER